MPLGFSIYESRVEPLPAAERAEIDAIPRLAARSAAKILVLTGVRDKAQHDKAVLDRAAAGRIFVEFSRRGPAQKPDPEQRKINALTEREIVAVTAAHAGANARVIADILHISEHTPRNHLTSIYDKLGVANRLELFAYAHQHGLAGPQSWGLHGNRTATPSGTLAAQRSPSASINRSSRA